MLLFSMSANQSIAYADTPSSFVAYAYMPADTVLYKDDGESICSLPATYFVVLADEEKNGKLAVSYLDIDGYVLASSVEIVDYEPVTKFASRTARVNNDGMAVNLRQTPDSVSGTLLCSVPATAVLTVYGAKTGAELFDGAGNTWQYVRYTPAGATPVYGYVYAPQLQCDPVVPNKIEKVEKPQPPKVEESATTLDVSRAGQIALIAAMCVPAAVLMLVLFYRPDSKRTPRHTRRA